jgi:DNA polymerase-2
MPQPSVAFIRTEQCDRVELVLCGEDATAPRPLSPSLNDFYRRPVLGPYCHKYRQLKTLEKRQQNGIDVYNPDEACTNLTVRWWLIYVSR